MRFFMPTLVLCFLASLFNCTPKASVFNQPMNAIVGNAGIASLVDLPVNSRTEQKNRIASHLSYVRNLLSDAVTDHLTAGQREKRELLLDHLTDYIHIGDFPKNFDFPNERKPCFIDKHGNVCAVGYLVQETLGRTYAEKINDRFQYDLIENIFLEEFDQWAAEYGVSKLELAMIQPTYGPPVEDKTIDRATGIYSSVFTGLNTTLLTINTMQLNSDEKKLAAPIVGFIGGTSQLITGIRGYPENRFFNNSYPYAQRNLSMFNIGLGTATIAMSSVNLLRKNPKKNKDSALNLYSLPMGNDAVAVGFSFTKKF